MLYEGYLIDASEFRKQLLSLSQGDLCGDCLAIVLSKLDDAPKIRKEEAEEEPSVFQLNLDVPDEEFKKIIDEWNKLGQIVVTPETALEKLATANEVDGGCTVKWLLDNRTD